MKEVLIEHGEIIILVPQVFRMMDFWLMEPA